MPSIPYVKKKIGQTYLVWFQNSNLYFQFDEPAWYVFSLITKRYKTSTIAQRFSHRYSFPLSESLHFIEEIRSEAEKINKPFYTQKDIRPFPKAINDYQVKPFTIHYYQLGNCVIQFSYETSLFEYWIHPLISHFETKAASDNMPLFELFEYQKQIAFRYNGEVMGLWAQDETQFVKGKIFMFFINLMHGKTADDWLMTVHASAITDGKKTILFTAKPGKGKTTFASLLQSHGYQLISDDFVPVDRHAGNAYPFPIAISVKQGSVELLKPVYPELEETKPVYLSAEKIVHYISPLNHKEVINEIHPVHALIFIEYNSSIDFQLEQIEPLPILKTLLDQVWVTPIQENASKFLDQIFQISFYNLTYSDNEKAMDAIKNLFDHEQ